MVTATQAREQQREYIEEQLDQIVYEVSKAKQSLNTLRNYLGERGLNCKFAEVSRTAKVAEELLATIQDSIENAPH